MEESERTVAFGTPLLELGDPSSLEIVVDVLTSDAVKVKPGARVLIDDWGGDEELGAHVRLVEPSAFTKVSALGVEEQRVNVIADFDVPRRGSATATASRRTSSSGKPRTRSRFPRARSSAVAANGAYSSPRTASPSGARSWSATAIRSNTKFFAGLAAGDRVLLHPSDLVEDGVRIKG